MVETNEDTPIRPNNIKIICACFIIVQMLYHSRKNSEFRYQNPLTTIRAYFCSYVYGAMDMRMVYKYIARWPACTVF